MTPDHVEKLFAGWQAAEARMHKALAAVNDDEQHPAFIEAARQVDEALQAFLHYPTPSIKAALLKLRIAAHYEDYFQQALDPECHFVAPRAIVAAIHDLEALLVPPTASI